MSVKIGEYIYFRVYRRSYFLWSPVIGQTVTVFPDTQEFWLGLDFFFFFSGKVVLILLREISSTTAPDFLIFLEIISLPFFGARARLGAVVTITGGHS